jgi:hypothetical protein
MMRCEDKAEHMHFRHMMERISQDGVGIDSRDFAYVVLPDLMSFFCIALNAWCYTGQ